MMKKNNIATLAAAMLMACGMMFAQTGDLPASRGVNESGIASTIAPAAKLPGAAGTLETPTTGASINGQRPGTGVQNGEKGLVLANSSVLPGSVSAAM